MDILQLISAGQDITIKACDGQRTIAKAKELFTGFLDADFENWNLDKPGKATPATKAKVYELRQDATFKQMFESLNPDLDKLCLTQAQIIAFIEDCRDWLRTKGYGTFFLFKENEEYFVATVHFRSSGGLRVLVDKLRARHSWTADGRHRLVLVV
ncbi:MAG: hypothetical protein PHR00_02210 [Patescibacteria group bacterium]|nr:hypothetical protein [Patescibacteria group bacterium]